jgi:TetR/AcrR family transcriptional regulator, lmrAB and yxaGH operons repressor
MARPQTVADDELMGRLSCVFREVGYEAASLAMLSEATGLQKASLYHRFPRGKQQMADEVLAGALAWYEANIFAEIRGKGTPAERLGRVIARLDAFYDGGRQACLLNMLASAKPGQGPFSAGIKSAFEALVDAFSSLVTDAGYPKNTARLRAERAVMLLHGSLVMSRGLGSSSPFKTCLAGLVDDLIGTSAATSFDADHTRRPSHDR